ncbi:hypothetical protein LOK49_LG07G01150 [Camellia lanceoleosa]|uniref:Uncharacterized protein n=1 Tax=Camellia lanceoleosa TaxID=1840588 RepID=A0ACC0H4T5_9ERIC|nr:hypothetical protein LOK49_LG07G01150 [Camellia lanceoleosa]
MVMVAIIVVVAVILNIPMVFASLIMFLDRKLGTKCLREKAVEEGFSNSKVKVGVVGAGIASIFEEVPQSSKCLDVTFAPSKEMRLSIPATAIREWLFRSSQSQVDHRLLITASPPPAPPPNPNPTAYPP